MYDANNLFFSSSGVWGTEEEEEEEEEGKRNVMMGSMPATEHTFTILRDVPIDIRSTGHSTPYYNESMDA